MSDIDCSSSSDSTSDSDESDVIIPSLEVDYEIMEGNSTSFRSEFANVGGCSEDLFPCSGPSVIPESEMGSDVEMDLELADPEPILLTIPTPTPTEENEWIWLPGDETISPEAFDESESGWTCDLNSGMREIDYFKLTFTKQVRDEIVYQTNLYAVQDFEKSESYSRRQLNFAVVTEDDLMRYLAIRILMGIDPKPSYPDYWCKDKLLQSVAVPQILPSDRFLEIQRYLHFNDNEEEPSEDKIIKIRSLWEKVTQTFQSLLVPYQDLSVDESLTKFRGKFKPKQFIPTKRNRFGIKSYSVVDAKTGFVLNSTIYCGKEVNQDRSENQKKYGCGGSVVKELCDIYSGKNRRIFCDSYFTSPALSENLLENQTYICGTLRQNRKHLPKPVPKLKKGDALAYTRKKNGKTYLVEYWKDSRMVRLLSTCMHHGMTTHISTTGKKRNKPESVVEYTSKARGIDFADMMIHTYDTGRKTNKWSTKSFFRLFDLAIFNAFVIKKSQVGNTAMLDFRLNLIRQIVDQTGGYNLFRAPALQMAKKTAPGHYPIKLQKIKRCVMCSKTTKSRSMYGCEQCGVALCIVPCFKKYHVKL